MCTGALSITPTNAADGSEYVLHHRGAANAKAVLDWTKTNYQDASNVFVAGCSAGGYASIFYTPLVRRDFPKAIVRQFADAAVAVPDPSRPGLNSHPWNITAAAPTWIPELDPAKVDYGKITLSDYYVRVAKAYPDVHLSQYTSSFDQIQTSFWHGGDLSSWNAAMYTALGAIKRTTPNFSYFVGPGDQHCGTWDNGFYDLASGGMLLRDWLSNETVGGPFRDVNCLSGQCGNPDGVK